MPTAIVVPRASPKAKRVAAKDATLKGIIGWWTRCAALMSIFTELHPKEICSKITNEDLYEEAFQRPT